jgi:hypothetical protein
MRTRQPKDHGHTALRRSLVLSMAILTSMTVLGTSRASSSHGPDAWIRLCGATNTCLNAPWHPWVGDNVHSPTGHGQTISAGVEEGNMIRFWILLQNDGPLDDTLRVKGCSGNSAFHVTGVNIGAWRFATRSATVTSPFGANSLSFSFPPATAGKTVIITLTLRAYTASAGVSYSCPITVSSAGAPSVKDTVVARVTTI